MLQAQVDLLQQLAEDSVVQAARPWCNTLWCQRLVRCVKLILGQALSQVFMSSRLLTSPYGHVALPKEPGRAGLLHCCCFVRILLHFCDYVVLQCTAPLRSHPQTAEGSDAGYAGASSLRGVSSDASLFRAAYLRGRAYPALPKVASMK